MFNQLNENEHRNEEEDVEDHRVDKKVKSNK